MLRTYESDLENVKVKRLPSPRNCIYCADTTAELTDEHIIPFALGGNTLILTKSCCKSCQRIIQPYEQDVLSRQLGTVRAQVRAPTRRPKSRSTNVPFSFSEVGADGEIIRDLGQRELLLDEAPIAINLWSSPPPRFGLPSDLLVDHTGRPWTYIDRPSAERCCKAVAQETGAIHVAMKLGEVNRENYLRFLAKMAHAYAVAELGQDGFEPFLIDVILKRSNDVNLYVGDAQMESPFEGNLAHTLQISLGECLDGPAAGCLVVRIQLYPMLNSPSHIIIVGRVNSATHNRVLG